MKIKKYDYGKKGPIIIWATFEFQENQTENTVTAIRNYFSAQDIIRIGIMEKYHLESR